MVVTLLGVLVSVSCVLASFERLRLVVDSWSLDPNQLAKQGRGVDAEAGGQGGTDPREALWTRLRAEVAALERAEWERELFEAFDAPAAGRAALVNQQLAELEHLSRRWARVPRVCASVSTSFGFLLAAVAVSSGLGSLEAELGDSVLVAVNAVAVGLAGTAFCISIQRRAETMVRERLVATDKLVMGMERRAQAADGDAAARCG